MPLIIASNERFIAPKIGRPSTLQLRLKVGQEEDLVSSMSDTPKWRQKLESHFPNIPQIAIAGHPGSASFDSFAYRAYLLSLSPIERYEHQTGPSNAFERLYVTMDLIMNLSFSQLRNVKSDEFAISFYKRDDQQAYRLEHEGVRQAHIIAPVKGLSITDRDFNFPRCWLNHSDSSKSLIGEIRYKTSALLSEEADRALFRNAIVFRDTLKLLAFLAECNWELQ